MRGNTSQEEATLLLDSGATSHVVEESVASALQEGVAIRGVASDIQLGESGKILRSKGRANIGNLANTLVVADGRLVDNIASVPQYDLEGRWILVGGQKARIGVLDKSGSFKVHVEAVLGADRTYRFLGSDLMSLPELEETLRVAQARPVMSIDYMHDVFGHRSKRACREAVVKGRLTGASPEQLVLRRGPVCEACAKAKATRHSFARARSDKAQAHLPSTLSPITPLEPNCDEVVTDIKGPIGVDGPNGERYLQIFTEKKTRWRTPKVYTLRSLAADAVKTFFGIDCARESLKLTRYHADGAPELISRDIVQFLAERGCRVTFSAPYTPEQNGLAEVSNRVIWEPAMTILMACTLPLLFWTYAVMYSTVIANCFPTWTSKGWMSPLECKYGIVPDISLFHKFGCLCYVHIPEQLRTGMAEKAYKGWFVGLDWPLWDRFLVFVPVLDKVVMSAHVIFDEISPTVRSDDHILVIDSERRKVEDFYFLRHMAYIDEGMMYVTTKVANYRGYICAFRAPWVEGRLGKEEPRPLHARDVEELLKQYLLHNVPTRYDVLTKTLSAVCIVDDSALVDESRQWVALPQIETDTSASVNPSDARMSSEAVTAVALPSTNGVDPSSSRKVRSGRSASSVVLNPGDDVSRSTNTNSGVPSEGSGSRKSKRVSFRDTNSTSSIVSSEASGITESGTVVSSTYPDDYNSGINSGETSFIGLSGFADDDVSAVRSRRRSAPRAPLNVGQFGNIADTIRLMHDVSKVTPLEKLAYLSAEKTLEVDLPDTHPMRWLKSKMNEIKSIVLENNVWDVVKLPAGFSAVDTRWINNHKTHPVPKDKSRYIARGFRQRKGVDYSETYAPVAKLTSLRIFLTLATVLHMFTYQMDIKTAFLNASLEEEIYLKPTSDLVDVMESLKNECTDEAGIARLATQISGLLSGGVLRLRKALYGLKQAPRQWWKKLLEFFTKLGFVATVSDACFLVLHLSDDTYAFVLVYVDDLLLACSKKSLLEELSKAIRERFRISSCGELGTFLGININCGANWSHLELGMSDYIDKIFKRFNLVPKQSVKSPMADNIYSQLVDVELADSIFVEDFQYREKIGSLIYLMICIRPDIAFAVSFLARYSDKVNKVVCTAVTRLLQYVYNTKDYTLKLSGDDPVITVFTDSDWAGCRETRLSTGGFIIFLGLGPIAWGSKVQKSPAQSVQEAEYMAMNDPLKIVQWLRWLLSETRVGRVIETLKYSSAVLGDNTAAHALAENPVASSKSKHIALKYHYVRHLRVCKVIHLGHVDSKSNCSDPLSKPVTIDVNKTLTPQMLGHEPFVVSGVRELKVVSDEYM